MKGSHKDWIMKGYKYVYRPDHPSAHKGGLLDGRILEHRLVAEEMIGRSLEKTESVHHIDRNRINNDPSNLMILDSKTHSLLHKLEENHIEPIMDSIEFAHTGRGIEYKLPDRLKHNTRGAKRTTIKEYEHMHCSKCGKELAFRMTSTKSKTGLCPECLKELSAAHIPSKEELIEELRGKSMEEVGRAHGVTGKSVKNWAIKRGININGLTKPVGFSKEAREKSQQPEAKAKLAMAVRDFWSHNIHPSSKAVEQLDDNGNVLATYPSAIAATKAFNQNDGSPIARACKNPDARYKGYHWRYKQ